MAIREEEAREILRTRCRADAQARRFVAEVERLRDHFLALRAANTARGRGEDAGHASEDVGAKAGGDPRG